MGSRITIKIKPKADSVQPTTEEVPALGKTINFSDIDKGGTKDRTWINYVNFVVRFYEPLGLPDKNVFYWEYLSKSTVINQIIREILTKYHIRDGNALAAKLSPFRSMVFRMEGEDSLQAVSIWGETVSNSRKNYVSLIEELGIEETALKSNYSAVPAATTSNSWLQSREFLHNISINKSIDVRVRVLAVIYKYGYIFRMSTIFRTYIHLGDSTNRDEYNFLDLDRCIWSIVDNRIQKLEFRVPKLMANQLKYLMQAEVFSKGWLIPQRRGNPYAPEASLSSFSSWTKAGMLNYRTYRKLYLEWLKTEVSEEDYQCFTNILDARVTFELISYIPPVPKQDLASEIESIDDPGQEIVPASENALAANF